MDSRRGVPGLIVALVILPASIGLPSCNRRTPSAPQKAPAISAAFSSYTPEKPYRQFAPGLLARTAYVAEKGDRHLVEIWDLLVGPGQKSGAARLPGAAVFEIRSGHGTVTVSGKSQDVQMGRIFPVNEGEEFVVANRSPEVGMAIRVTLVRRP